MASPIALDSTPLSILCHPDQTQPHVREVRSWLESHLTAGATVYVPEIADYEVRRKLLHLGIVKALRRLDDLQNLLTYLPLDTAMMHRAAESWAQARRQGKPAAPPEALDGDVILAAQVEAVGAIFATENPGHLELFVTAKSWQDLPP